MKRPNKDEYALYYHTYIEKVPDGNIVKSMNKQIAEAKRLFKNVTKKQSEFRYSPEKWSVKEVLGHILEAERIFAYRALRFARNDNKDLHGFDENEYIHQSNYSEIKLADLVEEFCALRTSNMLMFKNFTDDMSLRTGTSNGNKLSVRALAYIMTGHAHHHLKILKERYF
ncbi:MAG: DinB family protein [Ignavibacteriales bacterium]|nr:MAG: DinB family protein [Ignavibacteriales bacterium]